MGALSFELETRHIWVPVDMMLELMIEDRADLPINAFHTVSGYKAEMFLLKPGDALPESSLQRRRLLDLGPSLVQVYVHSPEDLILNKLRFYRSSQQTKHVRDIATIVLYQAEALGTAYIERWVPTLNFADEWQENQQRLAKLQGKS